MITQKEIASEPARKGFKKESNKKLTCGLNKTNSEPQEQSTLLKNSKTSTPSPLETPAADSKAPASSMTQRKD